MSKQRDLTHIAVIGRVVPRPRGEWSNKATYERMEFVTHNGNGYVCQEENVGKIPSLYESIWVLVVKKGEKGEKGERGKRGIDIPEFVGTWQSNLTYHAYEVVDYNGSSYICTKEGTFGIKPGTTTEEGYHTIIGDDDKQQITPIWKLVCKGVAYKIDKNGEVSFYNNENVVGIKTYTTSVYIKTENENGSVVETKLQDKIDKMQKQINKLAEAMQKYGLLDV